MAKKLEAPPTLRPLPAISERIAISFLIPNALRQTIKVYSIAVGGTIIQVMMTALHEFLEQQMSCSETLPSTIFERPRLPHEFMSVAITKHLDSKLEEYADNTGRKKTQVVNAALVHFFYSQGIDPYKNHSDFSRRALRLLQS